ncbi:MAG TPA: hypothetical protein VGC13_04940 [Longimicrobium sp.]|jgi:hypothetical protein|uniref:hypothetical protein n=1 Tax=Longimicrobium sp. TaxID=2029185 RepID=UPI002EDBB6A4
MDIIPLQVTITMSTATVTNLITSGYSLLAFAAVRCSDDAAQPLLWMARREYGRTNVVQAPRRFQAYTVPSPVQAGQVVPGYQENILLGQMLTVGETGTGAVTQGATPRAITIRNTSSRPLGCGISRVVDGRPAPICRLPLYGHNGQVIEPVPTILLMFSNLESAAGAPFDTAVGPGVLLDLRTVRQAQVTYDINGGWDWQRAPWGRAVEFGDPLRPLLVAPSTDLARRAELARNPALTSTSPR